MAMVSAEVSITLNVAAKGIMKINVMLASTTTVVLESKSWADTVEVDAEM